MKEDNTQKIVTLPCGHIFHTTCIIQMIQHQGESQTQPINQVYLGRCPYCKSSFGRKNDNWSHTPESSQKLANVFFT